LACDRVTTLALTDPRSPFLGDVRQRLLDKLDVDPVLGRRRSTRRVVDDRQPPAAEHLVDPRDVTRVALADVLPVRSLCRPALAINVEQVAVETPEHLTHWLLERKPQHVRR